MCNTNTYGQVNYNDFGSSLAEQRLADSWNLRVLRNSDSTWFNLSDIFHSFSRVLNRPLKVTPSSWEEFFDVTKPIVANSSCPLNKTSGISSNLNSTNTQTSKSFKKSCSRVHIGKVMRTNFFWATKELDNKYGLIELVLKMKIRTIITLLPFLPENYKSTDSLYFHFSRAVDRTILFKLFAIFNRFCDFDSIPMKISGKTVPFVFHKLGISAPMHER